MIHRCETCPFWKQDGSVVGDNHGLCQLALESTQYEVQVQAKAKAECRLVTSGRFGCVMHPMNKAIA